MIYWDRLWSVQFSYSGGSADRLYSQTTFRGVGEKAIVYLHGSFAATGEGHGTDKAIIAGLLGMKPDDLRIPDSFTVAEESGMEFIIAKREIRGAHPNTARVIMENGADKKMVMQAYSIGGGRIRVSVLDGIEVEMQIKMRKKRFGRGYFAI